MKALFAPLHFLLLLAALLRGVGELAMLQRWRLHDWLLRRMA